MARKLKRLRINEISCVDSGAGRGVRIVWFKRADGTDREIEMAAPASSIREITKMKRREAIEIAKRAVETGSEVPFTKRDLFGAIQRTADKQIDLPTPERRFAKFLE